MSIVVVASYVLCYAVCFVNNEELGQRINVRTGIFTDYDLQSSRCWSNDDIGLLFNRYILQELLPRKVLTNMTYFNDYMSQSMRAINDAVSSEIAIQMVMRALSDVFGGYLHGYGLPMARRAYYEGTLNIETLVKLYRRDKFFKDFLKTQGQNWMKPISVNKPLSPIKPMKVHINKKYDFCNDFILPIKENKTLLKTTNTTCKDFRHDCPEIPLPFLDDCKNPLAVAVPIRDQCLYSLTSPKSQGILSRYYEASINCIDRLSRNKDECHYCVVAFNRRFAKWLKNDVIGHLDDDTWYVALHGVLKVLKAATISAKTNTTGSGCVDGGSTKDDMINFVVTVAILLTLFWLIILLCLLCRYCCTFKDSVNECDEGCTECRNKCCNEKPARLFMYDLACWARPLEGSSSEWCKCSEPNYVDMERYESDSSTEMPQRTHNANYLDFTNDMTVD